MQQVDRRLHLVHVLAAGTAGAGRADFQVGRVDLNLDGVGLGHHRDGRRGGMNAPLGFGGGDPLHPVHARLEFQLAEHAVALDRQDQFLVAAEFRLRGTHRLHLPTNALGVALIHPRQVTGPDRRLVAASAGTDLQHHAAFIPGITGEQRQGQLLFHGRDLRRQAAQLLLGQGLHFLVPTGLLQELLGVLFLFTPLAELVIPVDQGFQPSPLPGDGLKLSWIGRHIRVGQLALQGVKSGARRLETFTQKGSIHESGLSQQKSRTPWSIRLEESRSRRT